LTELPPAHRPGFGEALRYWVRLGFVNFGGPAGQIAMMHRDLVEDRKWISEERFLHALNFCMLLPGPEAQQLAIYVGWLFHGTRGGVLAGVLFVLPSVLLLLVLSWIYAAHGSLPAVGGILAGLKPVVVAIVVAAVWRIGRRAFRSRVDAAIALAAFLAIRFANVPFPWIVLAAALAGLAVARSQNSSGPDRPQTSPLLPVEAFRDPVSTGRVSTVRRLLRIVSVGLLLWAGPFLALVAVRGWASLHAAEYRFFTQAAFVTFGGAYAVLAYVTQAAAGPFGWITHSQAIDGLALAETTPGPLIMVLQFVGFLAAWQRPEGLSPLASGILGGLATTWATFLPCFLFVLAGAPFIEALRENRRLSAALAGITAAVVGVIANLAFVFGEAVLFPRGLSGGLDLFSLFVGAAALAALVRRRLDLLWIIGAGAAAGLLRVLLG
jgi:chromate transporter